MKVAVAVFLIYVAAMMWWGVFDAIGHIGAGSRGDWTARYAITGLLTTIVFTVFAVIAIKAAGE